MLSKIQGKMVNTVFLILVVGIVVCFLYGALLLVPPSYTAPHEATNNDELTVEYSIQEVSPDSVRGDYVNYASLTTSEQELVDEVINTGEVTVEDGSDLPSTSHTQTINHNGDSYVLTAEVVHEDRPDDVARGFYLLLVTGGLYLVARFIFIRQVAVE